MNFCRAGRQWVGTYTYIGCDSFFVKEETEDGQEEFNCF